MIRFILVCFILIFFLIITLPLLVVEFVIGKFAPAAKEKSTRFLVRIMFKLFIFITGSKVELRGAHKLPKNEAVLFVGNHRSYFDILVTYSCLNQPVGFVAKDTMNKALILRIWMRNIRCLFLNRTDIRQGMKTILAGVEQIKCGTSVFIFPEGTRGKEEGKMADFKEGSLKIAQKAKCKVVPVALTNTAAIWENQFPKMKPAHVIMEIGDPIDIETLDAEDKKRLGAYSQNKIQQMLDSHNANK